MSLFSFLGLLEKPQFERGGKMYPMLSRRLFLVGRSGVGKTSTVHKLMGRGMFITPNTGRVSGNRVLM